jgi:hypothetical protein
VSIADGTVDDSSGIVVHFVISLDKPSAVPVTVQFDTKDGTGPGGLHDTGNPITTGYFGVHTTVTFNPGVVSQTVDVNVNNSNCSGATQFFFGDISNPTSATILRPEGIANIPDETGGC